MISLLKMSSVKEIEAGIFNKIFEDKDVLKEKKMSVDKYVSSPYSNILESEEEMNFEEVWDSIRDIDLTLCVESLFNHGVFRTCPNEIFKVQEYLKNLHSWPCKPPFEDFKKDTYTKWALFMNTWTLETKTKFLLAYICVYCVHCQHKITMQQYKDMINVFD